MHIDDGHAPHKTPVIQADESQIDAVDVTVESIDAESMVLYNDGVGGFGDCARR